MRVDIEHGSWVWEEDKMNLYPGQHVYVYSHLPNFGKTHQLSRRYYEPEVFELGMLFVEPVIFMDNYDYKSEIPLDRYDWTKGPTIVMVGRSSLYEKYARWDEALERHVISKAMADQVDSIFKSVRLDGDVKLDRLSAQHPSSWSEKDYASLMRRALTEVCHKIDRTEKSEERLDICIKLYCWSP